MKRLAVLASAATALALGALAAPSAVTAEPSGEAVLVTYADIAEATYEDAWLTAKVLQAAVDALLAAPGAATHAAAKDAWLARACPTSRPRRIASATRSSTTGRAGSTPGRSTRV